MEIYIYAYHLFVFQKCLTLAMSCHKVSDMQLGFNVLTELFRLVNTQHLEWMQILEGHSLAVMGVG